MIRGFEEFPSRFGWNPVKELKVDGVEVQDTLSPSQWNPVKELKV